MKRPSEWTEEDWEGLPDEFACPNCCCGCCGCECSDSDFEEETEDEG